MSWLAEIDGVAAMARPVAGARGIEISFAHSGSGEVLSARAFVDGLRSSAATRRLLGEVIVRSGFDAVFWEVMPLRSSRLDERLSFVVVDAPGLSRAYADPSDFREHFDRSDEEIVVFDNLSGDATLVAPRPPAADAEAYAHLAAFVRGAPAESVDRLWQTVGETLDRRLGRSDAPVWLSTSGLGVPWLHVRLDRRPKYYVHAPFRA